MSLDFVQIGPLHFIELVGRVFVSNCGVHRRLEGGQVELARIESAVAEQG